MPDERDVVKRAQWQFFARNRSGCAFAAYVAKQGAEKYGWRSLVLEDDPPLISEEVAAAIADPDVEILSLIFPAVRTIDSLIGLVEAFVQTDQFFDEGDTDSTTRFVRLRARVGADVSWVSGFGPFDFLPLTRQAPHCELTIRVKPRPSYEWYFKQPTEGIIHLADLNMRGLSDNNLKKLWGASFDTTKKILGHAPDNESAAKTTFVIPLNRLRNADTCGE